MSWPRTWPRCTIANPELARLRSGLLDALSHVPSGVDPAADEALAGEGADEYPP